MEPISLGKPSEKLPPEVCHSNRRTVGLFLRALGFVYLIAFLSLGVQIQGLLGSHGILPAQDWLDLVRENLGSFAAWKFPGFFWLHASDAALSGVCWAGAALACLLIAGLAPVPLLGLLWFLYLSLFSVGQTFLSFQWDILLLETGFLAIFLAPWTWRLRGNEPEPSQLSLWLVRWLLFRLMLLSGLVKLLSMDPVWWNLSALHLHYQTQPLPTWVGYYFHQCPLTFQKFSCAVMFGVEILLPCFIFGTRWMRWMRWIAFWGFVGLQALIALTGNYGFFNLLTLVLCLSLLDDARLPRKKSAPEKEEAKVQGRPWPRAVVTPVAVFLFLISLLPFLHRLGLSAYVPTPFARLYMATEGFHLTSSYGLFANMTTARREITVEGSMDGEHWQAYEFRYKPQDLGQRPGFVEPHMPRLDWQMWFAALAPFKREYWFQQFLLKLLHGEGPVLALLKSNPFPQGPPKYIRATIAEYQFTDLQEKKSTGNWWKAKASEAYSPILSLHEGP